MSILSATHTSTIYNMIVSSTTPLHSFIHYHKHSKYGCDSKNMKQSKKKSVISTMNKLAKGKLSLGAKILQVGGVEKAFRRMFNVSETEKLLKATQCCLFTTAGPLSGRLFISSENLAFCSDKAVAKYSSPSGETSRYHYKVVIPLRNIKKAHQSENVKKPSKKYLQVVTNDDFEFWFAGFLKFKKTFKNLQQALSWDSDS
ncbi:GEM-like protein 4 isoform X2 [Spinacia oleracea]|uniref:GEM-like protein 4 isoform X2 n=1 Tax=Spinacia oleracea TaxID=3562 RepID=A0ABM3R7I5_SPIOL|nr:GEM-like protein 4 isoform X2 [Spinacia oleracea]